MREKELRQHAKCTWCGKGIGHTGLPLFWTVRIERHGLNMPALERQQGLAMMLGGNGLLAQVMGADEEMTTPMMEPVTATLCEECAMIDIPFAALAERATPPAPAEKGKQL